MLGIMISWSIELNLSEQKLLKTYYFLNNDLFFLASNETIVILARKSSFTVAILIYYVWRVASFFILELLLLQIL